MTITQMYVNWAGLLSKARDKHPQTPVKSHSTLFNNISCAIRQKKLALNHGGRIRRACTGNQTANALSKAPSQIAQRKEGLQTLKVQNDKKKTRSTHQKPIVFGKQVFRNQTETAIRAVLRKSRVTHGYRLLFGWLRQRRVQQQRLRFINSTKNESWQLIILNK